MIIVGHLLGFEGDTAKTFEVVIQLGSILAVFVMFWRRLFGLIGIHFGRPLQHEGESKGRLTLIHILLGMIPAVVLGLLFHDTIKSLFNPINVMYALVISSRPGARGSFGFRHSAAISNRPPTTSAYITFIGPYDYCRSLVGV